MNSFRMICSTFIDWFAQSMRFFPMSARSRFFTSQLICVGVVDIPLLIHEYVNNPGIPAPPDLQNTRNGRPYLRLQAYGSVTRGRRQTSSVLPGLYRFAVCKAGSRRPDSLASLAALSVASQVKSLSVRPKCPYAAVLR